MGVLSWWPCLCPRVPFTPSPTCPESHPCVGIRTSGDQGERAQARAEAELRLTRRCQRLGPGGGPAGEGCGGHGCSERNQGRGGT